MIRERIPDVLELILEDKEGNEYVHYIPLSAPEAWDEDESHVYW